MSRPALTSLVAFPKKERLLAVHIAGAEPKAEPLVGIVPRASLLGKIEALVGWVIIFGGAYVALLLIGG